MRGPRVWAAGILALVMCAGCYDSHGIGGRRSGGGGAADGSVDARVTTPTNDAGDPSELPVSTGDLRCGPNVCLAGEVCCDAVCGACTLPDECVDYECTVVGP